MASIPAKKYPSASGDCLLSLQDMEAGSLAYPGQYSRYTILFIKEGKGIFQADFGNFSFEGPVIFFANPYQTIHFKEAPLSKVRMLQFHGDFYCIEYHKAEVACNGLLFNNIFLEPSISLLPEESVSFSELLAQLDTELSRQEPNEAVLTAYLQLYLAKASQIKLKSAPAEFKKTDAPLEDFKIALEANFLLMRKPSDYAALLKLSPNAFAKRCSRYFGKSPSRLIQERVVLEAKKKLHLSRHSIKEIAYSLNFEDEYYFSRFFKKLTKVSPQTFREKTGISIMADLSI
ncbi:AraC-type DNA-binding protein [Pedobacter steynii]|uniref:AraC-type DNA-binding protein n=1 Tax=Pedobacter steynii TaxID=430522 RepID=A0A1G9MUZ0_9SPHI|nr:helix-turn-helix domain-containing protein [Pedobacter steynii]NQX39489.1 AraC family transcriptional regulator [Pedobacter steynii]SDL78039.1 AraC-type DNA-binding protein [Pedobacter steynii]